MQRANTALRRRRIDSAFFRSEIVKLISPHSGNTGAPMRQIANFTIGKWAATAAAIAFGGCFASAYAAGSQGFDGRWQVTVQCSLARDGALPFTWRFPASVREGQFLGQKGEKGQPNSGTLSGEIGADGNALLTMQGFTGASRQTLTHPKEGSPFHYTVSAHFAGKQGAGKRNEDRECSLDFSRS